MSSTERRRNSMRAATQVGQRQAEQDRDQEAQQENAGAQRVSMALDRIQPRDHETRELNQEHVLALAGSIAALGLIEPIVVDRSERLLAGGHRFAALKHLRQHQPTVFAEHFRLDLVPVRILAFDAVESPDQALAVEVAENEQRRDYTRPEVLALAERLRLAGYKHKRGRIKEGDRALAPALMLALGKSRRTVVRLLTTEQTAEINAPTGAFKPGIDHLAATRFARALIAFRENLNQIPDSPYAAMLGVITEIEQKLANIVGSYGAAEGSPVADS